MPLANSKGGGSDQAASATSMRRGSYSWLPPGATGVGAPVGSPNLADRERATEAVSSEAVTRRAAAVRCSNCGKSHADGYFSRDFAP